MARTIFGFGAWGDLIKDVQQTLVNAGFPTNGVDGRYGPGTRTAVNSFQNSAQIPPTGVVDDGTWAQLMQSPIPPTSARSLQLTASFEGQGFELAVGNFDGALLTWGIIGFTLSNGEIQDIVAAVNRADGSLVPKAFGASAPELFHLMSASRAEQKAWAQANTIMPQGTLAEPWKSMFATFGSFLPVQQEQLNVVQQEYMLPAINTAKNLGLVSELGLALCFDIHVQDGGINSTAAASIAARRTPGIAEADLLPLIAQSVANAANPQWASAVRSRKVTIATGQGKVNGTIYTVSNWGLSIDVQAPELTS